MSEFDAVLNQHFEDKKQSQKNNPAQSSGGQGKKEKRNQCYAMIEEACLEAVSSPTKMMSFLTVQSRFEKYSLNNNLLIFRQRPGATRIKSFDDWKKADQSVKSGSKSFMILERVTYTSNGEERYGYNAKAMFDVSDLQQPPEQQTFRYEPKKLISALVHASPVPIATVQDYPADKSAGAFYSTKSKKIFARTGMSVDEIVTSIAQALVHAELAQENPNYRPEDHEFSARCVAYAIAAKYDISTENVKLLSIPPSYAGKEAEDVKPALAEIHDCVKTISERMREVLEANRSTLAKEEQEAR